jgi:hypothetical protein
MAQVEFNHPAGIRILIKLTGTGIEVSTPKKLLEKGVVQVECGPQRLIADLHQGHAIFTTEMRKGRVTVQIGSKTHTTHLDWPSVNVKQLRPFPSDAELREDQRVTGTYMASVQVCGLRVRVDACPPGLSWNMLWVLV